MKKIITLNEWDKLLIKLPFYDEPPNEAWLTISDFAKMCGVDSQTIRSAIKRGLFETAHLATTHKSKNQVGSGKIKLLMNWNALGYNYVSRKPKEHWPKDFKINADKLYKPIAVTGKTRVVTRNKKPQLSASLSHIDNLADAKLEKEKLNILQKRAEIQQAENEVLSIEDAAMLMMGVAHETKSQIRRAISLVAPKVAVTSDVLECRALLEDYLRRALECLGPLLVDIESLKHASRKTEEETPHEDRTGVVTDEDLEDSTGVSFSNMPD